MATCPRILAIDVSFSHEILDGAGLYFTVENISDVFQQVLGQPEQRQVFLERATWYDWDRVAEAYMSIVERKMPKYFSPNK